MRKWGLIAAGVATLLLLWAMSPMENRMQANGPGMVPFELSGGQDRADEILAEWGEALENACLLLTIGGAGAAFPFLATIFAVCKFALLATAIAYLVAGIAGLLGSRISTAAS